MNGDQIQELLMNVIRFSVVVFMLFYAAGSMIAWRQILEMHKQVHTKTGSLLLTLAIINAIVAIVLFLVSILIGFL